MNILLCLSKNIGKSSYLLRNSLKVAMIRPNVIQKRYVLCGEHDQKNCNLIKSLCPNALLNRSYSKHSNPTNEVEQGTREKSDGKDDKEALKVDEYDMYDLTTGEGNKVTELIVPSNNTDSKNEKQNIVNTYAPVIEASNNNKCDLQSVPNDDDTLNTEKNDTSIVPSTTVVDIKNLNQNIIKTHIPDIDTSTNDKCGLQTLANNDDTLNAEKSDTSIVPSTNIVDINLNQNIINAYIPDMDSSKNDKSGLQTLANNDDTLKINKSDESIEPSTNVVDINYLNQNIINAHIPNMDSFKNDKCGFQNLTNDEGTLKTNKSDESIEPSTNVVDINYLNQNIINTHIPDIDTSTNDKYGLQTLANNDDTLKTNKSDESIEPSTNIVDINYLNQNIINTHIPDIDTSTNDKCGLQTLPNNEGTLKTNKSDESIEPSTNIVDINYLNQNIINAHIPDIDTSNNDKCALQTLANDDGTLKTNKNYEIVIDIDYLIQNTINNYIPDMEPSNNDKYDLNFIPNGDNTSSTNEQVINNYRKDEKSIEPFINVAQYNIQITDMDPLDDDIVSWSREYLTPINDFPAKPSDYIGTFKKLFKSSKAYNKSNNFQNIYTHIPHIDASENEESSLNFLVELIDNDIIAKLKFLGKWSNLDKSNVPVDTAVAWKEEENCYIDINKRSENNKYKNWFMIPTDIGTFAIYLNPPISNLSTIMGLLVHTDLKIKWYTGRPRLNLSTSKVNSFENKKLNTYSFLFVTRDAEGTLEINTAAAIPEPKEQDHLELFVENKKWHYLFLKITNEGMCYINIDPIYNSSSMFDGLFVPSNYHICWNKHYPIVNIIIPCDNKVSKYWYAMLVTKNSEGRIQINVLPYYECIGAIRRNEGYRIVNTHIPPGFYSNATKIMVHSVYQHHLPRSGTLDEKSDPPTDDTIEFNENVVIDVLTPEGFCNNANES